MILKVKSDNLKVGFLGLRAEFVSNNCKEDINKHVLKSEIDIDETFDMVLLLGHYKMIPENIIQMPKYGIYCLHESPLPEGRGHAPIQWAILNKRPNLTMSLFHINRGVDTGLIAHQHNVPIDKTDTYKVIDENRKKGQSDCFNIFIKDVLDSGVIKLTEQTGNGDYHKKRNPSDSELDATKPLVDLWDNIRMCDNINFPAFFRIGDKKVILRYEVENDRR
jgi:methionyl-tRNA formyltransferase